MLLKNYDCNLQMSQHGKKIVSEGPFQPCLMFFVRSEPTKMKHLSHAPLLDELSALPTNTNLGQKGLPGKNTMAY
jgi:hypothetical protein